MNFLYSINQMSNKIMKSEIFDDYEVVSDGTKVWVNSKKGCVARFCRLSSELPNMETHDWIYHLDHKGNFLDAWIKFKERVFSYYHIIINDRHRPNFVKELVDKGQPSRASLNLSA